MRKVLYFFFAVWFSWAGVRVSLHYGFGQKQDNGFREIYGKNVNLPGFKIEAGIAKGLFVYGNYDYLTKEGKTAVFEEKAKTSHHYFSLGFGLEGKLKGSLYAGARAGAVYINYQEEALGEKEKNSCVGFEIAGGLRLYIKRLFLEGSIGYLKASDKVEGVKIKFDGPKAEFGIGLSI